MVAGRPGRYRHPMDLLPDEVAIWSGHPSWRASLSFHVKGFVLSFAPLALVLLVRVAGGGISLWWGVLGLVAGVALTVLASWVLRVFTQYTITTKRLQIRRGILSKTESSTSIDRLQNITVFQSPVDRILQVGTIDFDTASDDPSDRFSFEGVDDPRDLREQIMRARDADQSSGRIAGPDRQGGLA